MKTATEITATAIYKVTSKIDGKTCWAVPSDSQPNTYYKTCFDENTHGWTCSCKHGEFQAAKGQDAHCKHTKAAQTSIKANKPVESVKGTLSSNAVEHKVEVAPSGNKVWMR